jgi:hypothetical protein
MGGVIIGCLDFGFIYVFSRAFYRGEKWSRWAWLALFVLGVASIPNQLSRMRDASLSTDLLLAAMLVQLVSVALLYVPRSHRWFSVPISRPGGRV